MSSQNNFTYLSECVESQYQKYRKHGKSRDIALELIYQEHKYALCDDDDRFAILAGLVLALCKKRELLESIAKETFAEIQLIKKNYAEDSANYKYSIQIEKMLKDIEMYGSEAPYKQTSIYRPDWMIGDTFSHTLTYPTAEELGIKGWIVLLHKVGDYVDGDGVPRQLMCVSLCPPDRIPSCYEELQNLGFLPMMYFGERAEYLAQIVLKSKRQENAYNLTKIGCFKKTGDSLLETFKNENPLTVMPLLGRLKKDDPWPAYEDQICRLYKKYRRRKAGE